ncbi:hypothetical protein CsSME_00043307 [Camellia sinensis var. sinensis]
MKTRVVKKNCNPVWNEELTLSIKDPNVPIILCMIKTHLAMMTKWVTRR